MVGEQESGEGKPVGSWRMPESHPRAQSLVDY